MAERSRRVRRQISDIIEDSSDASDAESDDFDPRKSDASRRGGRNDGFSSAPARSKRGAANSSWLTGTQKQSSSALDDKRQSIKLTMKVAPSKLREVMRANEVESLQDTLGGGKVIHGPRATRRATQGRTSAGRQGRRLRYQEYTESDIEVDEAEGVPEETVLNDFDEIGAEAEGGTEDDEEEEDDDDEEDEDDDEEDDDEEDEEEEEEGGDDGDDEDVEMEDAPPPMKKTASVPKPPKITLKTPVKGYYRNPTKPKLVVTPANVGPLKSVEEQEMEDDLDDEEVEGSSDLSDNERNGNNTNLNDEEMEGDEDIGEDEEDEEGDEDDLDEDEDDELGDSSDETPASGQATPDPARMTQRQRGRPGETLMALDMAPQQRKFFTDAEKAMKKDEHARKRKELTKRKTQEEKTAALNRLLKPQVSKSRGAAPKADTLAAQIQAAVEEEELDIKADPLYTRWIHTKEGTRLGVPEEWLGKHVGKYFGPPLPPPIGALIQEVE